MAASFYVHFDDTGKLSIMKERRVVSQRLPNAKRRGPSPYNQRIKGGESRGFYRWETVMPPIFKEWEQDRRKQGAPAQSPEEMAMTLCCVCLSSKRPENSILVRASHHGMVASWTIDRRDGKRFFAKRSTGLATDGKRKRILHYVGDFTRNTGAGAQYVREHYRGERSFSWMGYSIEVSGLGFHHRDIYDSNILTQEFDGETPKGFMSIAKASKYVRQQYSSPYFLSKHP